MKYTLIDARGLARIWRCTKVVAFLLIPVLLAMYISGIFFKNSDLHAEALEAMTEKSIIILDAGHGGEDCGAIGANGIYEKELNLLIVNELAALFSDAGYTVVFTRQDDRMLYSEEENIKGMRKLSDLRNRCKIGAEYSDSLFISIHMNAYSQPQYSGLHTYYSTNSDESHALASAIQSNVISTIQPENNRVPKPGKNIYLLENMTNVAVLVECGFLSNPEECEKLCQKEYQKQLSYSIFCGIMNYLDKTS